MYIETRQVTLPAWHWRKLAL